jgi:hypothetical protein
MSGHCASDVTGPAKSRLLDLALHESMHYTSEFIQAVIDAIDTRPWDLSLLGSRLITAVVYLLVYTEHAECTHSTMIS